MKEVHILHTFHFQLFCREDNAEKRLQRSVFADEIDSKMGFDRYKDPEEKAGWLLNMHPVSSPLTKDFGKNSS